MHRPTNDPNTPKLNRVDNADSYASGAYPNPDLPPTQTSTQDLRLHTTDLILTLGSATLRRGLRVSSYMERLATSDDCFDDLLLTCDDRFDNKLTTFRQHMTTYDNI